jgi:carbonic anhydrase
MTKDCCGEGLTRRQWLNVSAGIGLAASDMAASPAAAKPKADPPAPEPTPANAEEALTRLKSGNRRFVEGRARHTHENASWRQMLVAEQKPFATILGCSDSRVPPELVFDVGLGELFIARLAGNIIAEDVVGTLQYAIAHLHTSLVVVMGHEGCGAVTAAVDDLLKKNHEPSHIEALLQLIEPGLAKVDLKQERDALLRAAVEANVRWSMQQLVAVPEGERAIRDGKVTLVGAVYELASGNVRFL